MTLLIMRNAARFSKPTDSVLVTLRSLDTSIELCVKDSGIGILTDEQPRVFEPFFRGSNINEIGGLGLGLAIARDSVEACGGTISLESVPDHGMTVYIRLPQKL